MVFLPVFLFAAYANLILAIRGLIAKGSDFLSNNIFYAARVIRRHSARKILDYIHLAAIPHDRDSHYVEICIQQILAMRIGGHQRLVRVRRGIIESHILASLVKMQVALSESRRQCQLSRELMGKRAVLLLFQRVSLRGQI